MSEITINLIDNSRIISGYAHGSIGDELLASLAAEPETIAELEDAHQRFRSKDSDFNPFGFFYEGFDPEPYDAGILVIDLGARVVACDSTYSGASKEGTVHIRTDDEGRFPMPYKLADDWKFVRSVEHYHGIADDRRAARSSRARVDYREILFGPPLFEFIAAARDLHKGDDDEFLFTNIHAKWLVTPREDLDGRSPRDVMLEKHDLIGADLHSRALQWSFTKECPAPLPTDSDAFRFAGFGTNEIVVYYDLVRDVLAAAFADENADAELLEAYASEWLSSPNGEFSDRIPLEIIDAERRRMNLTVSPIECIVDEDCEICQMMAADFDTPMFWHLDGSGMEYDRYEFSFFRTKEEFEDDQRRFNEFNLRFEKTYQAADWFEGDPF